MFHLKEFTDTLMNLGVDCKLVVDTDICRGFPSRKITEWVQTRRKFDHLISEFKPDAIFTDRQSHFTLISTNSKISTFIHLRGDYWSEIKWFKETVRDPIQRFMVFLKNRISEKCFRNSTEILPICKYLENIVKTHYPNKKSSVMYQGIASSHWYPAEGMK
ncbi:MAG: glycosyltransferase family 1 protein, partial [Nitrosarchaeum sp.]